MKATDLKVGSVVNAYYFNGNATVTEIKDGKQIVFSLNENESRLARVNVMKNKVKRMSVKDTQKMMELDEKYKMTIVSI